MKTLNLLRLASVCALFALGTATFTSCDPEDEKQIELPDKTEAIQKGYADDETTGGFTFVAKAAWTANVKEGLPTRANDVSWLRLKYEGSEKYSGEAGTFTLVIEIDPNYDGVTRTATITIISGSDKIVVTVTQDGKTKQGEVPVDPGKGMKYITGITVQEDAYTFNKVFEYDTQNRVVKITRSGNNTDDGPEAVTFSYSADGRKITITEEGNTGVWNLNAAGAIESATAWDEPVTVSYTDGYISRFVVSPNDPEYEEIFTMTWSGGNMSGSTHSWKEGGTGSVSHTLNYNSSWPNNPLCNLDLNALIFNLDDGVFEGLAEILGLLGKRSQHMISGFTTSGGNHAQDSYTSTVEYDTDGFVKKITVNEHDDETCVYTITYR